MCWTSASIASSALSPKRSSVLRLPIQRPTAKTLTTASKISAPKPSIKAVAIRIRNGRLFASALAGLPGVDLAVQEKGFGDISHSD